MEIMHFEILVEGQTELSALSVLMKKIVGCYGEPHTWKIHKHRGIGSLPDNLEDIPDTRNKSLLHNFPSKLRAYGKGMLESEAVVLLVDLDDRRDCVVFKSELNSVLGFCEKQPNLLIRIAIEELEAWYFGDENAIKQAFPKYSKNVVNSYVQDSQEGTWEKLANAVHPGGLAKLMGGGKRSLRILEQKKRWTVQIVPYMDVENNQSPSFRCFRDGIRKLAKESLSE